MPTAVRMLGSPAVTFDGRTFEPSPTKGTAMLMYLAFAPGWVPRDDLVFLLWPDHEESRARRNLRQLLHSLKNVPYARDVLAERTRVQWEVMHDVQRFERAVERGALDEALAAYGGPFLDGISVSGVPEVDAWVELERARLERAWRDATIDHAAMLVEAGRPRDAERILSAATRADPYDEEAFHAWMKASAAGGRVVQALQGYETFAETLREAVGIEPSARTLELAATIGARGSASAPSVSLTDHGAKRLRALQSPPSHHAELRFIGRDRERRELVRQLEAASAPIISIVAPGGMGKTRLAAEVASSVRERYPDGVAFASLEDAGGAADAEAAVATAVGLVPSGRRGVLEQLTAHLANQHMLLVLDNLEHLTSDLAWLAEIVERCRDVQILATSRERLRLVGESVFDLRGLSTPGRDASDPGSHDAVRLFAHAARRVGHDFGRDRQDVIEAGRLARAVEGMPLAMALAAAWLRVLPLEEIATEVEQGLELLQSDDRDRVDRHRSMAAVFEATWTRLRDTERRAWARLSVFEGSFSRAAATDVAEVGLPMLLGLVNKSVLMHVGNGRYAFHPLLRQFGSVQAERLGIGRDVRQRHAAFFLTWVSEFELDFKSEGQFEALQTIATDLANIRAAWRVAVREHAWPLLSNAVIALAVFYRFRKRDYLPGGTWSRMCTNAVREIEHSLDGDDDPNMDHREAWTLMSRILGFAADHSDSFPERAAKALGYAQRSGDLLGQALAHLQSEQAGGVVGYRSHLERALQCFQALGDKHGQAVVHFDRGVRAVQAGHGDEAVASLRLAHELFSDVRGIRMMANSLDWLARAYLLIDDQGQAERCIDDARGILERLGLAEPLTETLTTRRLLALARGDLDEAERHQEAYIAYFERDGRDIGLEANSLRAYLAFRRGRLETARRHALAALALCRPSDARVDAATLTTLLARIDTRTAHADRARAYLVDAAEIAFALDAPRIHVDVAIAAAAWLWHHGDPNDARSLLGRAVRDRVVGVDGRWEVQRLAVEGCAPDLEDDVDPRRDLRARIDAALDVSG